MKTGMIIGVVIHIFITITLFLDSEIFFMGFFGLAIVLANFIGIIVMKTGNIIVGAKIFMISSALLVPIGLIGALSARNVIEEYKKEEFNKSLINK